MSEVNTSNFVILDTTELKLLAIKTFKMAAGRHIGFLYLQYRAQIVANQMLKKTPNMLILSAIE